MTTLFPYQEEGVKGLEAFGLRGLLADDMGLGKSVQALTVLARNPQLRPAIIVCPASIKWHWEHEAVKHYGMRVQVLEGRKVPRDGIKTDGTIILNYDILNAWLPKLLELEPKIVVADESHYCRSPSTRRTKAMKVLAQASPHFLALSGTPLANRPIELWPILNMIKPKKFRSRFQFGHAFCRPRRTRWGWDFTGACRLPKLHRLLTKHCMVRRLKQDVLKDLPEKRRIVVPMTLEGRKEYTEASRDIVSWLRKAHGAQGLPSAMRAEALVKMGHLKRLAAKLKLPSLLSWVADYLDNTDQKLILFGIHKAVVAAIKEKFPGCAVVTGDVTGKDREMQFRKFNKDKKCRLFVGNIQAAGVGWSATSCSTVAFAELSWVPGEHSQAEDRVRGIGRGVAGQASESYWLVAHGTLEEKLCQMLERKQRVLDQVMDGRIVDDMDVFDQLMKSLMEGKA